MFSNLTAAAETVGRPWRRRLGRVAHPLRSKWWGRDDDPSLRIAHIFTDQNLLPKLKGKPFNILNPLCRTRALDSPFPTCFWINRLSSAQGQGQPLRIVIVFVKGTRINSSLFEQIHKVLRYKMDIFCQRA